MIWTELFVELSKKKYFSAKPNLKAIEKINSLYRKGFYIKIFTARFMGRNQENVKKAKKQGYKKTLNQLKNWNLKFDKLILENPHMIYLLMINQCFLKKTGILKLIR